MAGSRLALACALASVLTATEAAAQCETLLKVLACSEAVFAFRVVGGPRAIPYYPEGDRSGNPEVATTYRVRVTHVFSTRSGELRPGVAVTAGHYGGTIIWQGKTLGMGSEMPRLERGRTYLGFAEHYAEPQLFLFHEGQTFVEAPSGLESIEGDTTDLGGGTRRLVAGHSVLTLIARAAAERDAATRRIAAAAAATARLPVIARASDVLAIYRVVRDTTCPRPANGPTRPVIQRELSVSPLLAWLKLMKSVESQGAHPVSLASVASTVGVSAALLDRLLLLRDARLPDESAVVLDVTLTDAAAVLRLQQVHSSAGALQLSPVAFDDDGSTALVYCSARSGTLVHLSRVDGRWVVSVARELWVS